MQSRFFFILASVLVCFILDIYVFYSLKSSIEKWSKLKRKLFVNAYWFWSIVLISYGFTAVFVKLPVWINAIFMTCVAFTYVSKLFYAVFLSIDDIRRLFVWIFRKSSKIKDSHEKISRSEFLLKSGVALASIPLASLSFGLVAGAYDYRVKHRTLYLKNLPKAFDGIKIGQVSDIHSGSFYRKNAVLGGVEMLLAEKPDVVFFTGDLVNNEASEMRDYQDIFSKIKAPLGVYSVLGNHDYGDYISWPSIEAKRKNLENVIQTHKNMGWDILMNENRRLKIGNEEIGILGIENWGTGRFPKHGRMDLATQNTDDLPVKLLLSHDPSHWRAQVLESYPQIDAMFAGHTHGMQLGISIGDFQLSPSSLIYKEWSGLYKENNQQLYVNVGFGFLGLPGRVGILPEITIFELKQC